MNILLGSHGFPPRQAAGAEWETYRRARWLNDHGHTARVLAIDEVDLARGAESRLSPDEVDGINVQRLSYGLDQLAGTRAEFDNPIVREALEGLLAAERPDVFHLISGYRMTGSAILAARARGIPVVVTLTDFWFVCPRIVLRRSTGEVCGVPEDPQDCALCLLNERRRYRVPYRATFGSSNAMLKHLWRGAGFAGFQHARHMSETMAARRRFQAEALAGADQVITASRFLAEVVKRQGVKDHQIRVMRQGVNIASRPRRDREPGRPLTFGYVGQLADHKGVDVLVAAFRRLPLGPGEARLMIYGNPAKAWPPFWRRLERQIGGDARITVAGPFAPADAPGAYAGLDILVVPSIWYENSPNVILEAFACGVPVMASDLGGMAELIEHERNGCLFPANDVPALTRTLRRVIDHPEVLLDWRAAIPPVKTIQQEMDELIELYWRVSRLHMADGVSPSATSDRSCDTRVARSNLRRNR